MAYKSLKIDLPNWPLVERFIRGPLETFYFWEVHAMLRLPRLEDGIRDMCAFSIAHSLLAATSGISTTLVNPGKNKTGARFQNLLVDHYPWEKEQHPPTTVEDKKKIAKTLYDEFRGPATHNLGLDIIERKGEQPVPRTSGYAVKFERFLEPDSSGLREAKIETLEQSREWPFSVMKQTLVEREDAKFLKLERLYWGLRETVIRLTEKESVLNAAEAFFRRGNTD